MSEANLLQTMKAIRDDCQAWLDVAAKTTDSPSNLIRRIHTAADEAVKAAKPPVKAKSGGRAPTPPKEKL